MKYIIAESKRDHMVDMFLDDYVGEISIHHHPASMVDYVWWTDKDGRTVFEGDGLTDEASLGVDEKLWNTIERMFSLTSHETDLAFMRFVEQRSKYKFPDGVYTFESNND